MLIYIIPTYECNLNCRFCYAQKYKNIYTESLSWDKFIGIYKKFSCSLDRVAFIGGEAVKWKFINEAILYLKNKNINVSLFTNGVDILNAMPDNVIINASNIINMLQSEKIVNNINAYKKNNVKVTLRYNVDENFFVHINNSVEIAKRYADAVSLSVLFPIDYGNKIIGNNLFLLAKELQDNKIKTRISRATPMCLFTDNQRTFLENNCNMRSTCSLPSNALVINPDGISAQPCVELAIIKNINVFPDEHIKNLYKSEINEIKNSVSDVCKKCKFFAEKKCYGGCLAYKY